MTTTRIGDIFCVKSLATIHPATYDIEMVKDSATIGTVVLYRVTSTIQKNHPNQNPAADAVEMDTEIAATPTTHALMAKTFGVLLCKSREILGLVRVPIFTKNGTATNDHGAFVVRGHVAHSFLARLHCTYLSRIPNSPPRRPPHSMRNRYDMDGFDALTMTTAPRAAMQPLNTFQ